MKKISAHFGLNHVNPARYSGWDGLLSGCNNDATDMKIAATAAGFDAATLFDGDCTRAAIQHAFDSARSLIPGDTLLVTFSGHGSMDEAICCFDDLFYDWELHNAAAAVAANGARVVVVLDSCHAGGMDKDYDPRQRKKVMPASVDYEVKRDTWPPLPAEDIQAGAFVLLAAAESWQFALDGTRNGAFTECLKVAFQAALDGHRNLNWGDWLAAAQVRCAQLYPTQSPVLKAHGPQAGALIAENIIT